MIRLDGYSLNNEFLSTLERDPGSAKGFLLDIEVQLRTSGCFGRRNDNGGMEPYAFTTPLFLEANKRAVVSEVVSIIQSALQDIGRRLKKGEDLLPGLDVYTRSTTFNDFCFDHGYESLAPIVRLDIAVSDDRPRVLEVNSGCPGGELDGGLLADVFCENKRFRAIVKEMNGESGGLRLKARDPREESLLKLLEVYEEFRQRRRPDLPKQPAIGIITSEAQKEILQPEVTGIAEFYRTQGVEAWTGDLADLRMNSRGLLVDGREIHLLFRKFSTISFLKRLEDAARYPYLGDVGRGYRAHSFCMVNPLSSTLLQDKGLLAVLWRDYPETAGIMPETHVLRHSLFEERSDLGKLIMGGEEYILKRRISFGGKWVFLEPSDIRGKAQELLATQPGKWIVQKRVKTRKDRFWTVHNGRVSKGNHSYIIACFGESFYIRVSRGDEYEPINAENNGAETCLFEVGM